MILSQLSKHLIDNCELNGDKSNACQYHKSMKNSSHIKSDYINSNAQKFKILLFKYLLIHSGLANFLFINLIFGTRVVEFN